MRRVAQISFLSRSLCISPLRYVTTSPSFHIQEVLEKATANAFPEVDKKEIGKMCSQITKARKGFGYQSPISFNRSLCNISETTNPMDVANKLIRNIPSSSSIKKLSIVGKGFIQIDLHEEWMAQCVSSVLSKPWAPSNNKKALVDYSSPNMAKEMHVGHLRSIVQGEFLSRLLERVGGYTVSRVSHVGDFGTPMGTVIAFCKENDVHLEKLSSTQELTDIYVQASEKKKSDPLFVEKSLTTTLALQGGSDLDIEKKWHRICEVSRAGFTEIQEWFDVHPKEVGESFYKDKLASIVKELKEKEIAVESEGAQLVFIPMGKKTVPFIIQKKDSSFLYSTTDLGALQHRTQELNMNRIIYLTDSAQQLHFQQLFYVGDMLGWLTCKDGSRCQVDHAHFGAVLGADGTRMKSRQGTPVRLKDFIHQAETKAQEALARAVFNKGSTDIKRVAQAAIKYYELSNQRTHNYKFSFDHMLQFHGNTGAYLLYAYSRLISILEKFYDAPFSSDLLIPDPSATLILSHDKEIALGSHLIQFWDVMDTALRLLSSNVLCDFLFVLASHFSSFYEHCPVLQSDERLSRIELCKATASLLLKGFDILNIVPTRL